MSKIALFGLLTLMPLSIFGQNADSASVSLWSGNGQTRIYHLNQGTFSYRNTNTFFDMTSWDSSPYGEGHLYFNSTPGNPATRQFVMNYRLLSPLGYDANFDPGYPLVIVLHDKPQTGNCANSGSCASTNCYYSTSCWNPNDAPVGANVRLLNNDLQLIYGGEDFLAARNLAGTKKPGAPDLDSRAFPGFVVFPQSLNGWDDTNTVANALRLVRLLAAEYNIDHDKIFIQGMGNGALGTFKALNIAEWLFASATTMSAADALAYLNSTSYDSVKNVPLWIFQGENDIKPTPAETESLVRKIKLKGGMVRYEKLQQTGNATWEKAFAHPDFFAWMLSHDKSNIHVFYDHPDLCIGQPHRVRLGLSHGFFSYQWERNGVKVPEENSHNLRTILPGTYRARFSRKSNPAESDWNQWSPPVVVGEEEPVKPTVHAEGTAFLPALNDATTITLTTSPGAAKYFWYKDGVLFNTAADADTVSRLTIPAGNTGVWRLQTSAFDGCKSLESDVHYLFFQNSPAPVTLPKPTVFQARILSPSSVLLNWNDVSNQERHYEVWRRISTNPTWEFVALTDEDQIFFHDTGLVPGSQYWYKVRAVNNSATSAYAPGDSKTDPSPAQNLVVNLQAETVLPSAPYDLEASVTDVNAVTLKWRSSSDASGIREYYIHYGANVIRTYSTDTTYTVRNLPLNSLLYFKIRAIDNAGNFSSFSNQVSTSTYLTGVFYKMKNGSYTNATGVPDIRLAAWSSGSFGADFPNNVRVNIAIAGTGPNYAGTFNTAPGNYVLAESVVLKRGGLRFGRVTPEGKIIRNSDGVHIGNADLFNPSGAFSFAHPLGGNFTIDYTWTFFPEASGKLTNFSTAAAPAGPLTQDDQFIIEYDGYLNINAAGTYQFRSISNDAVLLYVDGALVCSDFNGDAANSNTESTNTSLDVVLTAGPHRITVRFLEHIESHRLTIQYRGTTAGLDAGQTFVDIPDNALKSYGTFTAPPVPTAPTALVAASGGQTQINLSWNYNGIIHIAVLGSSTSEGVAATLPYATNGWVGRFVAWFRTQVPGTTLSNLSVGGYRTVDVIPSGPATKNITFAMATYPHFIFVNLPTNDVSSNYPNASTMANYRTIKAIADARGVPMYITTTQPRNISSQTERFKLKIQADSIRNAFGANVIDILEELSDATYNIEPVYNSGDGIHLNDAGHIYIYNTARDFIIPKMSVFTSYEVHRATNVNGPYTQIATVNAKLFTDTNVEAGKTYYYKVRTATVNGLSLFTTVSSATTGGDATPPSTPAGLTANASFSKMMLQWDASSDNIAVKGYEVFVDGTKVGTSAVPAYAVEDLAAGTSHNFFVKAFDAAGNTSAASSTVNATTLTTTTFYSKSTGQLNALNTWGVNNDGSGAAPTSFSGNGQNYIVGNRASASVGSAWRVEGDLSKVIIADGVSVTNTAPLDATVEINGSGTLVLGGTHVPEFGSLSQQSTVVYNAAAEIKKVSYGNLSLMGSGVKIFDTGETEVRGNLSVAPGLSLQGAFRNLSSLKVFGDIIFNGQPGPVEPDAAIHLVANRNGLQQFSSHGDLSLFKITTGPNTTLSLNPAGPTIALHLGSASGGGLSLATGSRLSISGTTVVLSGAAVINPLTESGVIASSGGMLEITSSSPFNSRIFFDGTDYTLRRFAQNLTGAGKTIFQNRVDISHGLKIFNGEVVSGGNVRLLSNSERTANLEEIEGTGSITGDVSVQRFVPAKARMYRYMSAPVAGVKVENWQQYFPITGNFTGQSTGFTSNPSMFYYNDHAREWLPFPPPLTNNQVVLQKGVGYAVFLRNGDSNVTMEVKGSAHQGDITLPIMSDISSSSQDGWNLVGNPYASTISWGNDGWVKSGLNQSVSVRQNPEGVFRYYYYDPILESGVGNLTDGKIAPGQSFWVQAITANPTLIVKESAKVDEDGTFHRTRESSVPHFIVNLSNNVSSDATFVVFTEAGTPSYDPGIDAPKRQNDFLSLGTKSIDGTVLAINNVGPLRCRTEVPLHMTNLAAGNYEFIFDNVDALTNFDMVELIDVVAGATIDARAQKRYSFAIANTTDPLNAARFKIVITPKKLPVPRLMTTKENCHDALLQLSFTEMVSDADYSVFDLSGKMISNEQSVDGLTTILSIPATNLRDGLNRVEVRGFDKRCGLRETLMTTEVAYVKPTGVEVPASFSVCAGGMVRVNASGAPDGGKYYWFAENGERFTSTGSSLELRNVTEKISIQVAAVTPAGCEGPRSSVAVEGVDLREPSLQLVNEKLVTNATGMLTWKRNGEIIANETLSTLVPKLSGLYSVTVAQGGCVKTSEAFEYINTDVESNYHKLALEIFPNPSIAGEVVLHIIPVADDMITIELADAVGRKCLREMLVSHGRPLTHRIDLGMRPAGIYFVSVQQRSDGVIKKLIIKD